MQSLRFLVTSLLFLYSSVALAVEYNFTGSGNWNDSTNWADGMIPPSVLASGSTITISGNAVVGDTDCAQHPDCKDPGQFDGNNGTVIISAGGSLTLNNSTQFFNGGRIIINGTLINNTTFQAYQPSTISVHGVLTNNASFGNAGQITINNKGIINNLAGASFSCAGPPPMAGLKWENPGRLDIQQGGTLNNQVAAKLFEAGKLTNNGNLNMNAM